MTSSKSRDSAYTLDRLRKLGRTDLLEKIAAKEMSVYAASIEAGFRKRKSDPSRAAQLTYHWSRADKRNRERFMIDHFQEIDELRKELVARVRAKAKKPTE